MEYEIALPNMIIIISLTTTMLTNHDDSFVIITALFRVYISLPFAYTLRGIF